MDRFSWTDGLLTGEECLVTNQCGVRLYDGEDKVRTPGENNIQDSVVFAMKNVNMS